MRLAIVVLAACTAPQQPALEHHARIPARETFMLDAPLFKTHDVSPVLWTLERDGENAHLVLGNRDFVGTAREDGDRLELDLGGATMSCRRTTVQVHAAGAKPQPRGAHPVCSTPLAWQPADLVATAALACTVHRDHLTTQVTMAPPPGLQAVVDDCCDDDDRCERRWEIRRRAGW